MTITPETISAYKMILDFPKAYKFNTPSWSEMVVNSEVCIPKHILYNDINKIYPNLPKFIFYLIADERLRIGKSESGEAGYYAKIVDDYQQ